MNAVWCRFAVGLACLWAAGWAGAADATSATLMAGRDLYFGRTAPAGGAWVEGVKLPFSGCAQCHGTQGQAQTEAGVQIPSVRWTDLSRATRERDAYRDDRALLVALTEGRGAHGRLLQAPMPRFELSAQEAAALLAFLKVLGTDAQPVSGLYPDRIVIGSVLPQEPDPARPGMRSALQSRVDAANSQGGLFGRRIELRLADAGPTRESAARAAEVLAASGEVFALVGSFLPDPGQKLLATLRQHGVPSVATLGQPWGDSRDRYLTYLVPSLLAQARHLDGQLQRRCAPNEPDSPVLWFYPAGTVMARQMAALPADIGHVQPVPLAGAPDLGAVLNAGVSRRAIAFVGQATLEDLRAQWQKIPGGAQGWCVGTLTAVSGLPGKALAGVKAEAVGLPVPADFLEALALGRRSLWPALADAAAGTFLEALARAGRRVDAQALLDALEGLHQHPVAAGLSVSFSSQRRHGLDADTIWRESDHVSSTVQR